jgi:hypothetical protein
VLLLLVCRTVRRVMHTLVLLWQLIRALKLALLPYSPSGFPPQPQQVHQGLFLATHLAQTPSLQQQQQQQQQQPAVMLSVCCSLQCHPGHQGLPRLPLQLLLLSLQQQRHLQMGGSQGCTSIWVTCSSSNKSSRSMSRGRSMWSCNSTAVAVCIAEHSQRCHPPQPPAALCHLAGIASSTWLPNHTSQHSEVASTAGAPAHCVLRTRSRCPSALLWVLTHLLMHLQLMLLLHLLLRQRLLGPVPPYCRCSQPPAPAASQTGMRRLKQHWGRC